MLHPRKSPSPVARENRQGPPKLFAERRSILLTIAGFDPSSGAGMTADLKVFAAHHLYGVAAISALTVQSTAGVRRVEPVAATLLRETLDCLAGDLPLAGIKIGMLATAANVDEVAAFLEGLAEEGDRIPVVLDPVLCSSSGHPLLEQNGLQRLRDRLLPLVSCVTPNVDELLLLTGRTPKRATEQETDRSTLAEAAAVLARLHPHLAIVATGGHLAEPEDYVLSPAVPPAWLPGRFIDTPAVHGTGCAHSSALLCGLVKGLCLLDAARAAKDYVTEALAAATPMGQGGGSMHHLYDLVPSHKREES